MSDNIPNIHMPQPSYWPIVLAFSLVLTAIGVIFSLVISVVGLVLLVACIIGWTLENRSREAEAGHEPVSTSGGGE